MNASLLRPYVFCAVFLSFCSVLSLAEPAQDTSETNLVATHYDLKLQVHPAQRQFEAEASVKYRNDGSKSVQRIPLMLYRLLRVQGVAEATGKPLRFKQQVVAMSDEETWQVNEVTVELPVPLRARQEGRLQLRYRGTIAGYAEVMRYVKDQIDERYSLFRAETLPYPVLGTASIANWRRLYLSPFTYSVRVTVPKGYSAVCGGTPAAQHASGEEVEFACTASKPQRQLNIAIAKFAQAEDSADQLRVYSLPDDAGEGARVLTELKRALDFYTGYFGPHAGTTGMTVVEIPDGWGSYTGEGFIFQAAAAFKDPKANDELYHEVAHRWNAPTNPQIQRCRWFDEAFASYFEALAVRAFSGESGYADDLQRARKIFNRSARKNQKVADVPIADYGKYEMGDYSYTKGAWSLYVLHKVVGEEAFRRTITQFLKEYESKPAGFADFQRVAEQVSGRNLQRYFDEWIFGAESSRLLLLEEPVERIVERYKPASPSEAEPAK